MQVVIEVVPVITTGALPILIFSPVAFTEDPFAGVKVENNFKSKKS